MTETLTTGGEVYVDQYDDCRVYGRIEISDSVVVCYNKHGYQKDVYPLSRVESIHTHTSDEEESAEWW